jgi:hypothetical protein
LLLLLQLLYEQCSGLSTDSFRSESSADRKF